jgi:hypothetical protein
MSDPTMLATRVASRLLAVAFAALALSTVACGRVHVDDARGPDGSNDWKSISCRHMDKRCYRKAAEICPNGYYFARGAGAISAPIAAAAPTDEAGEEGAGAVSGGPGAVAPRPQAGVNARTLPPQERWGSGMYSRHGGTILVQCADARATASR